MDSKKESQEIVAVDNQNDKEIKKKKKKKKRLLKWIIYSFLWLIILLQLSGNKTINFIFTSIIPLPVLGFLSKYDYILYFFLLIPILMYFKIHKVILGILGFLFFPITFFVIIVPKFGFKTISFSFKSISEAYSFSKTFKYKILFVGLFIISTITIVKAEDEILIITAMAILILQLFFHFIKRFSSISAPIRIFNKVQESTFHGWEKAKKELVYKRIEKWKKIDPNDKKYNKEKTECLKLVWVINRIFFRLSNYLRKLKSNRLVVSYFIYAIISTLTFTILLFSFEYYALERLDPSSFKGIVGPEIIDTIYLSFTTIITINFGDIIPVTGWARFFISLEVLSGLTIGVILFFIFTTVTIERYKRELIDFSEKLSKEEILLKDVIEKEYEKKLNEIIPSVVDAIQGKNKNEKIKKWFNLDDHEIN